jgi:hypothetical protein
VITIYSDSSEEVPRNSDLMNLLIEAESKLVLETSTRVEFEAQYRHFIKSVTRVMSIHAGQNIQFTGKTLLILAFMFEFQLERASTFSQS